MTAHRPGLVVSAAKPVAPSAALHREFLRFLAAGLLAAIVNVAVRAALGPVLPFAVAIVPAYAAGMATAFVLNRLFVFHFASRGDARRQAWRFVLVNMVGLAQVWAVGIVLAGTVLPALRWTWHADTVAHAIAVAVPMVTSYAGHRWFSFRVTTDEAVRAETR